FGAIGFVVLSFGFSLYARYFGHYDKVYGTLGAVIAFLFYAYLIGTLILLGAELVEQYALLRETGHVVTDACDIPEEQQRHGGELRRAAGRPAGSQGAREIPLFVLAKDAHAPKGRKQETVTAAEAFPNESESFESAGPTALGSRS
ncbi:MAG TPA: YhjD/YihY/BrkB family envelope integrity protein, partial [Dehalococcoidia bacterium]|nr:YhjD/YihY/BrkB family envelope integrity protein [Dehalococcoidia bacterium]